MSFYKTWLACCIVCVLLMVTIGGFTRLTGSGLSITEWKPITGAIPPITKSQWQTELKKYSKTPEFRAIGGHISMSDFKTIYLIEYFHRLFGRLVGIVFLAPFLYFLLARKLQRSSLIVLATVLVFGFLQGFLGWYMVKSGLNLKPSVSHFRLAMHLGMASLIFFLLCYEFFRVSCQEKTENPSTGITSFLTAAIFLQIIFGAFVAGLKAGYVYNTFPLMAGSLIPKEILQSKTFSDFFYNQASVQFLHRCFGILIFSLSLVLAIWSYINKKVYIYKMLTFSALTLLQVFLGVVTLLYVVPIDVALLHQALAFVLFGFCASFFVTEKTHNKIPEVKDSKESI